MVSSSGTGSPATCGVAGLITVIETWFGPVPIVGFAPLSFVPSSTSPICLGVVLSVEGVTGLETTSLGVNSILLTTTTFTSTSLEAVVCPFSVIVYLSVYSPTGVSASTFTLPVAVSIVTLGSEVAV